MKYALLDGLLRVPLRRLVFLLQHRELVLQRADILVLLEQALLILLVLRLRLLRTRYGRVRLRAQRVQFLIAARSGDIRQ